MFSSNSLDKNCVGYDNCMSGRNATRFPVGMTSLGDENQQIRIQLAVHKYNSSANSQLNNRTSVVSPVRHSFLKNSLKAKNFEGDADRSGKSEKKNGNKYEGVGAFPTIHLRKSSVRYRPIRRFNDVKIPYPELPVNRFLSHLPEVNSDLKSNARSVLDVLEDLSGKKIHSNDENKPKLKGLGGDYLSNPNAVYKPLFVQKPKIGSILTRDNTTQTLSPADSEAPSPQSSNSISKNDPTDPRAELRRKLAKQNNEIFASLSSSISSSFAIKRKIDKVLPTKDDDYTTEESAAKKSKTDQSKNHVNNNDSRISRSKLKSVDSVTNRKSKTNEVNSPTSPNKDRLTTIFLDMRNTSPKAQIFEKNTTDTAKVTEKKETDLTNGFEPSVNTGADASKPKNSTVATTEKVDSPDGKKEESEASKPMFNFPMNKTSPDVPKSAPSFQLNSGTNFSFPVTTSSEVSKVSMTANNNENSQPQAEPSTKPDFSSFKFGAVTNVSPAEDSDKAKPQVSESVPVVTTSSITPQFNFGTTITTTASLPSAASFGISQSTTVPVKPMFTFGQNTSLSQPTKDDKVETSNPVPTTAAVTSQPIGFSFGQKSVESPAQNAVGWSPPTSQSDVTSFSSPASAVSNNSVIPNGKSLFTFGQTAETPTTSSTLVTTNQEQKFGFAFGQKPDTGNVEGLGQKSAFFFGQKTTTQDTNARAAVVTTVTSPSRAPTAQPTSLFGTSTTFGLSSAPALTPSLGAKSEAESLPSSTAPVSSQNSTDFSGKTPLFTPSTSGFVSNITEASTGFGTTTTSASGFKFGATATTQSAPTFGVSSASQTMPVFGATTTSQSIIGFGTSTTSQSITGFGTSTTSQSITGFGTSTTTQSSGAFGAPVSNTGFGISRQPSFTFGISTTTQTTPSFANSQTTPAFGTSSVTQSTPSFGIPSTAQSSSFGVSSTSMSTSGFETATTTTSAFGSPAFGAPSSQPSPAFGAPTSTQSGLQFGATSGFSTTSSTLPKTTFGAPTITSTSGFGATQSSFSQPFGSKPPATSLGQTSNIFGPNPIPSFSSNTSFNSNQNNVFGQKPNEGGNMFDQNKIQAPAFGAATQPFGTPNKFSFGMSTSNTTGFTTSPPNTTAAPVFSFGSNATGNTFTFGSNNAGSNSAQTPFAFKGPTSEPFKFGASTTKQGTGFGGTSTPTFTFSGQINNNAIAEQKPAFNFGSNQQVSSSPFNFGTTPSPSVFSFGSSTSSAGSGSTFNFGTPTPGGPFGQPASASPGTPFAVPGTFSIGSGSSQSRPRATSRPRRRP